MHGEAGGTGGAPEVAVREASRGRAGRRRESARGSRCSIAAERREVRVMEKRIGFLSFGHWQPIPGSQVRTGRDALVQSVELAVAAEEVGLDGAYVRVHHFARQLASPFPLLAAMAARTRRVEVGTGVIDMRYENPLYMAEEAAATDLLSDGRLQLGISRGSPETALRGSEAFGYVPPEGGSDADLARDKAALFLAAVEGQTVVD